ncbi:MAG: LysR family transcriptional regulator [Advenella sp.]|uniref:LysR family transcriptional regulator n=1 Tax=unclassified Advenella TaxID=2685285 RepID=UPI001865D41A|nr:LysR family transcriptional regulator [Advenella sp. FME57]
MSSAPKGNKLVEMELFVATIEAGNFSLAARHFCMSPSAVSKAVARLEARLRVTLLNRSTRKLSLTPAGESFFHRSKCLLSELDDIEAGMTLDTLPSGPLRINTNVPFGELILLPLVPLFQTQFPDITLNIDLTDDVVDMYDARVDVAIRAGQLSNSDLYARKLGQSPRVIVAAPAYLQKHGMPQQPEDLTRYHKLDLNLSRSFRGWRMEKDGQALQVSIDAQIKVNNGMSLKHLAMQGAGLARLTRFIVDKELQSGELVQVLDKYNSQESESFYAVFMGKRDLMPRRVAVFLDFLTEHTVLR